MELGRTDIFM